MYNPITFTPNSELAEIWAILETTSNEGDSVAFSEAIHRVKWDVLTEAQFANAVQLALSAGEHVAARKLATEGSAKYPQSPLLAKMARVLAPPKVVKR